MCQRIKTKTEAAADKATGIDNKEEINGFYGRIKQKTKGKKREDRWRNMKILMKR